jgi:hypothetical protein
MISNIPNKELPEKIKKTVSGQLDFIMKENYISSNLKKFIFMYLPLAIFFIIIPLSIWIIFIQSYISNSVNQVTDLLDILILLFNDLKLKTFLQITGIGFIFYFIFVKFILINDTGRWIISTKESLYILKNNGKVQKKIDWENIYLPKNCAKRKGKFLNLTIVDKEKKVKIILEKLHLLRIIPILDVIRKKLEDIRSKDQED